MKRKSTFIKKSTIKEQNTLEKFGIFKKVNLLKQENEKETIKIKKEKIEDEENEKKIENIIKNENMMECEAEENSELGRGNEEISANKKEEMNKEDINENNIPLHKIYQPICKEDYINEIRSSTNPLLKKVLDEDINFNLIIYGPPGSGKSSLINVIKNKTKHLFIYLFHLNNLNNELRKIYDQSLINYKHYKKKTILCVKDINRLNKNQQEQLLLILKKGHLFLIATCLFNPMSILNASLNSRCLFLYLRSYDKKELRLIIERIINKLDIKIEEEALNIIMNHSCGDARVAIGIIDFAIQNMKKIELRENIEITNIKKNMEEKKLDEIIGETKSEEIHVHPSLQNEKRSIQFDDIKYFLQNFPCNDNKLDHYNFISGLHKSIRAGNVKAAILYLTKSLKNGEDPLYICRRLIRIASEDIGLANHDVLSMCVNTHYACKAIGMPECQTALIYAVIVLCKSSKSNYVYVVENNAKNICNEYSFTVPFHLRNTSNKYIYTNQPEILTFEEHLNKYKDIQKYLPDHLENLEILPEL
ncbi:DNA helicase, putative [Plasmodium gallinaceum]|uniref:DNA helicase, putative n=1 Tax=Plasmodium gallinaceum TaxID=5849 RepID=A0A1J1GUG9_PLAGA|nr:DNA helicase, putative [Plasmodium gallinaceum]CRG96177.1 DNA helicase, putative [Plasmodium gallinaceum]